MVSYMLSRFSIAGVICCLLGAISAACVTTDTSGDLQREQTNSAKHAWSVARKSGSSEVIKAYIVRWQNVDAAATFVSAAKVLTEQRWILLSKHYQRVFDRETGIKSLKRIYNNNLSRLNTALYYQDTWNKHRVGLPFPVRSCQQTAQWICKGRKFLDQIKYSGDYSSFPDCNRHLSKVLTTGRRANQSNCRTIITRIVEKYRKRDEEERNYNDDNMSISYLVITTLVEGAAPAIAQAKNMAYYGSCKRLRKSCAQTIIAAKKLPNITVLERARQINSGRLDRLSIEQKLRFCDSYSRVFETYSQAETKMSEELCSTMNKTLNKLNFIR